MDSHQYFYNAAINQAVAFLDARDGINAASTIKTACSRHSFSEAAIIAAVRTKLAADHGIKADQYAATLNAGFSMLKGGK